MAKLQTVLSKGETSDIGEKKGISPDSLAKIFSKSILKLLHRRISIAFAVVFTGITQRSLQAYKIRFPSTPFGKHFLDRTPQNNFFSKCVFSTFAINICFYVLSTVIHVKRCTGDKNNITCSH